jgi:CO/xanthine dehydrogenase FAD-binding subunit
MEYIVPNSLLEIRKILMQSKRKALLIAGGTNVIPSLRAKAIKSDILIDISHLKNLSFIKEEKSKIRIGGLTTIAELASSKIIQKYAPILFEAANQLGNPLVRNRATIAGILPMLLRLQMLPFLYLLWRQQSLPIEIEERAFVTS